MDLHNTRLARTPYATALAFATAENVATARRRLMINCRSRISFKLQQNEIDFAARGKFMWSIWPFELSELFRPGLLVQLMYDELYV